MHSLKMRSFVVGTITFLALITPLRTSARVNCKGYYSDTRAYERFAKAAQRFWSSASEADVRTCRERLRSRFRGFKRTTPLHLAVEHSSDPAVVGALLEGGADVNDSRMRGGGTPLSIAVRHGAELAIVNALLEAGANPDSHILEFAVEHSADLAVLNALLEAGANPDGTRFGYTPLHSAVRYNAGPAVVSALLEGGADPNYTSSKFGTPLQFAVQHGAGPAVVSALLEAGANPDERSGDKTSLHLAAEHSTEPGVVSALLEAGANAGAKTKEGATAADFAGSNPALKYTEAYTRLRDTTEALSDCEGYLPETEETTIMHFWNSVSEARVRTCVQLLGSRSRTESGYIPLHLAAKYSAEPAVVSALLEAGADPNARASGGLTPLHAAIRHDADLAVVSALLEAGADPNARASGGFTPLHAAIRHDADLTVVSALLEAGAAPDTRTAGGQNPLHIAVRYSVDPAVLGALLRAGANPNAKSNGMTPLHYAQVNEKFRDTEAYQQLLDTTTSEISTRAEPSLLGTCRVGQQLKFGQGCELYGGAIFKINEKGCITNLKSLLQFIPADGSAVELSFSVGLTQCATGRMKVGRFITQSNEEGTTWRIESVP